MNKDDAITVMNDLIENCKDGEYGFRTSAEYAKRPDLKSLFERRADDCAMGARELQAHVRDLGGEPEQGGTAAGTLHRGWVSVRGTIAGYSDLAMLEECERGEDAALARYRKAMQDEELPSSLRPTLQRHLDGVQRNHDQIRTLRDSMRAAS